jgi:tight adherence protein B
MSALLLAAALLIYPRPAGRRLPAPARTRRRIPAVALAAIIGGALVPVLPGTAILAGAIVVATATLRRRRRQHASRRAVESVALQGALEVLVGELRVGAHPVAAFETAAVDASGAVASALRAVAARARLGADVAGGLRSVAAGSALPLHWERLAVCWQLAQAHGLAIATLMRAAQLDIVERERFSSRVNAGMAGARTTAAVLAGLPVLGIALGQAIGADPVGYLLRGGGWLLVIGVGLAATGLLWSDRITAAVTT